MIDLTIRLRESPDAGEYEFRLVSDGVRPSAGSTLPDPAAALAAVERYGEDIFFPKPGPPKLCTQQYGGPQVAVVTGTFHGRAVEAVFTRIDGCEISRWKTMAPLLGNSTGASGAT
ncbi:serine protease inhibitor [Pseudarthrobacter sp. NPDC058329]|uniref:serine protease inhibitor n=1 Tax=Pseudarthrobacter sp. NPDC058329 TaxID=3346448 RepID=UPI0036DDBEA9